MKVELPMPELNYAHIREIEKNIEKSGLTNNLLKNELLDHLCCEVEAEMENGHSFQQAYYNTFSRYSKKDFSKTKRNIHFLINYKSFVTSGLLYLSIITYILSWLFHMNEADWFGLIAFLLVGLIFLRYSVIFNKDREFKHNTLLSAMSGIVFVLFLTGSVFHFLKFSFGIGYPHIMPMLLFSWLLFSLMAVLYYKNILKLYKKPLSKKRINVFLIITLVHLLLALVSFSTLIFAPLEKLIPVLAGIIVVSDVLFFIITLFIKQKGKLVLQSIILASFLMVFLYFPHKAIAKPERYEVQFEVNTKQKLNKGQLYVHVNYFKYGKETLILDAMNDSVYRSKPIEITGGNIEMAVKITAERRDTYDVLYNSDIKGTSLHLNRNDTIFSIQYNP